MIGHFLVLLDMQQLVFVDQEPEQEEKNKNEKKNFAWCQMLIQRSTPKLVTQILMCKMMPLCTLMSFEDHHASRTINMETVAMFDKHLDTVRNAHEHFSKAHCVTTEMPQATTCAEPCIVKTCEWLAHAHEINDDSPKFPDTGNLSAAPSEVDNDEMKEIKECSIPHLHIWQQQMWCETSTSPRKCWSADWPMPVTVVGATYFWVPADHAHYEPTRHA